MQHTHAIEGITTAPSVPDIGFGAHAHASIAAAPPLDHQSATIAAAASISEHAPAVGSSANSAAASIAEPLVCCPHTTNAMHGAAASDEMDGGVVRLSWMSLRRLVGCSEVPRAASDDVAGLWGGAAGLLHLQHPLAVCCAE